ncbi:MAG: thioredoxin-disulfide reductase [Victivallales bacterium]|nr:thioredoxin-disulfide reductase [Victivallales bacterium]
MQKTQASCLCAVTSAGGELFGWMREHPLTQAKMSEKTVILGSGPAGLTAAIYAARAGLSPLVLTGSLPGGVLTQTTAVENFPGFPDPIQGYELMERLKTQAKRQGAVLRSATATSVDLDKFGGTHRITLEDGSAVETDTLIVATGARPRELGLPSESALKGHGVSYCTTCDGPFYRGKNVVVVGGGDTALEEARFLASLAAQVTIVHRRDEFRATPALVDSVRNLANVRILWNKTVVEIADPATAKVTGVTLRDVKSEAQSDISCDAVFVAIGHQPDTGLFEGKLPMEEGYLTLPWPPCTRTEIPGVFAAGDCADPRYRQAVNAAAMGCRAAMDAVEYLQN